jgi:hypothetical protein
VPREHVGKGSIVAAMITAAFAAAWLAINSFNESSKSVRFDRSYTWYVDYDSATGDEVLVRGKNIGSIRDDANRLILALNRSTADAEVSRTQGDSLQNELPTILLQKLAQRTAFIEVANDQYLTQSMGSSGAQAWLAGVTYTLTEHPNIRAVDFSFTPGEHAMFGVYTRDSFGDYKLDAGK